MRCSSSKTIQNMIYPRSAPAPTPSPNPASPARSTRFVSNALPCNSPRNILRLQGSLNDRCSRARTSSRRSEEHTSELQSLAYLVCRLLLEKKKKSSHHQCCLNRSKQNVCTP